MQTNTKYQDASLLLLRLIIAAIFLVATYYKLAFWQSAPEGMPSSMVTLMKFLSIVESLGALGVVFGLLTRYAASGLAIIMVGAIFITKFMMHEGFVTSTGAGWNFPLIMLAGCVILIAFGAGRWSVETKALMFYPQIEVYS